MSYFFFSQIEILNLKFRNHYRLLKVMRMTGDSSCGACRHAAGGDVSIGYSRDS